MEVVDVEGSARGEAVGRARPGRLPRRAESTRRIPRGERLPGDVGVRSPRRAEGATGLRPRAQAMERRVAADRARHVRAESLAAARGARAVPDRLDAVPGRRRDHLRDRRRPGGGAHLPLHPAHGRLRGEVVLAAVAELADRGRDPRRLRRAPSGRGVRRPLRCGAEPQRGRLDRRPERDPQLHGAQRSRRAVERGPGADPGAGAPVRARGRDPGLRLQAVLRAAHPLPRRGVPLQEGPLRDRGRRRRGSRPDRFVAVRRRVGEGADREGAAAVPPRPHRAAARDEPTPRAVGGRHARGGAIAL